LNGKSYSMGAAMPFRKFYCAKCGAKLEKERTHRVVTKGDRDYYRYQSPNKFPHRDWDVYGYRFRCSACNARITYEDQCIIEKIQKMQGKAVLSDEEIKSHYQEGKKIRSKNALLRSILFSAGFLLLAFVLFCMRGEGESRSTFLAGALVLLILTIATAVDAVRRYQGDYRVGIRGGYSYETETLLQKLHTYATANKALVEKAEKCYCFRCNKVWEKRRIKSFADDGQTALCPGCGAAAILPDSIDETLDEKTLALMHDYWF